MPPKRKPLRELFDERLQTGAPDECWSWIGSHRPDGYGNIRTGRKNHLAHRLAYTFLIGPITEGLVIDHLCRNRGCTNPAHMELVTRGENTRRGLMLRDRNPSSAKTHCPQGHRYDEENTYRTRDGRRLCLICKRKGDARRARQKRATMPPGTYAAYTREYRAKNRERINAQERERRARRKTEPSTQMSGR